MSTTIEDGKGSSYKVYVDNENRLHSTCAVETMLAYRSHYDATAFGITTPMLTINTTGGRMLYIKNTSTLYRFYFSDFWFNWNGGSTNYNRPCYGQFIFGDTEPTTNITTSAAGVLNRISSNTADLTVLYWNGTGNGMTGHTAGTVAFYWCFSVNPAHYYTAGAIILGTNDSISINLQGEETGSASINILGFMKST